MEGADESTMETLEFFETRTKVLIRVVWYDVKSQM